MGTRKLIEIQYRFIDLKSPEKLAARGAGTSDRRYWHEWRFRPINACIGTLTPPPESGRKRRDDGAPRQLPQRSQTFRAQAMARRHRADRGDDGACAASMPACIDLRTDEAYYWTWSKENVLSFLDHPPMIAWFIRFGTAIFGDTNFGARFAGLVAMFGTQLLLADIVWRVTRDIRAAVIAVAMMEASLYYGLLMAKVAPDVPLILFVTAMAWALVRLAESDDARWWLAAGLFAGLAPLSKFTVAFADSGGARLHVGAGLARALAAQSLSMDGGR